MADDFGSGSAGSGDRGVSRDAWSRSDSEPDNEGGINQSTFTDVDLDGSGSGQGPVRSWDSPPTGKQIVIFFLTKMNFKNYFQLIDKNSTFHAHDC